MNEDSMKELERLRKQISQQEKMASLGLLSAGIAHEIQNPLNFVINFSKLSCKLLQDMEDVLDELESKLSAEVDEEIREIMDDLKSNMCKIEENGNRASSIVRGILLYSRGKDNEYIPTDICQLTKEYVWLSYHAVRANNKSFNVTIIEEYDNTLPLVKVIPQDFSRAVLNLMNNACYAVFSKSISTVNGRDNYTVNQGNLRNQGYELTLNFVPINTMLNSQRETLYAVLPHQTGRRRNRSRPLYHQVDHRTKT